MKKKMFAALMTALLMIICLVLTACGSPEQTGTTAGSSAAGAKVLSFTTTDMDGKEVTSKEIFGESKYTMVNCWASWCGPCVRELPEIEEMSKEFEKKGGRVIGILMDGGEAAGLAGGKDIIADTGVTYLNIIGNREINAALRLKAYPTTFFVDSDGAIVGEAVIGAYTSRYISIMNGLLGE